MFTDPKRLTVTVTAFGGTVSLMYLCRKFVKEK